MPAMPSLAFAPACAAASERARFTPDAVVDSEHAARQAQDS
jgi:hypothetical protein